MKPVPKPDDLYEAMMHKSVGMYHAATLARKLTDPNDGDLSQTFLVMIADGFAANKVLEAVRHCTGPDVMCRFVWTLLDRNKYDLDGPPTDVEKYGLEVVSLGNTLLMCVSDPYGDALMTIRDKLAEWVHWRNEQFGRTMPAEQAAQVVDSCLLTAEYFDADKNRQMPGDYPAFLAELKRRRG